jgi:hypothetical protein
MSTALYRLTPPQWAVLRRLAARPMPYDDLRVATGADRDELVELSDDHGLIHALTPTGTYLGLITTQLVAHATRLEWRTNPKNDSTYAHPTVHLHVGLSGAGSDAERRLRPLQRVLSHLAEHPRTSIAPLRAHTSASDDQLDQLDRRGFILTRRPDDHTDRTPAPLHIRPATARDSLVATLTPKGHTYLEP